MILRNLPKTTNIMGILTIILIDKAGNPKEEKQRKKEEALDIFPYPLHPMVVHFPIALLVTALGLELSSHLFKRESLHRSALQIFILAALVTPLVVRTGLWEAERLHLSHPVLELHQNFALWTMWTALMSCPILWYLKKAEAKFFHIFFFLVLISLVSFVSLTAHQGGRMVYEYAVGVEQ